ncbi:MAG: hypothetical protein NVS1B13_04620 [Flavisolibacter sp.]
MPNSLFKANNGLDISFLDDAYGDDSQTAALMFQQYLDELPSNLELLTASLLSKDIEAFRHLIHKQKPVYSYVGLTDVTHSLQDLQIKCLKTEDLIAQKALIDSVLERIKTSAPQIRQTLSHLQSH